MTPDKLPAIQFYPGDWKKDPGVRSMTYKLRGIWFEILLIMHESEDRGKLVLNGRAMTAEELGQMLGLEVAKTEQVIEQILSKGVASKDEAGIIYNRRMVRDEEIREKRAKCGALGGEQTASRRQANPHQKRTPSVSSSTSSSVSPSKKEKEKKDIASPHGAAQPAPRVGGKQRRYKPEDFQRAKDFMLMKWKYKNGSYLFSAGDGSLLSRLLGNYGLPKTLAILDLFWEESANDDWFRDKRDFRGLNLMLPKLMDNGKIAALEKKYQDAEPKNAQAVADVAALVKSATHAVPGKAVTA